MVTIPDVLTFARKLKGESIETLGRPRRFLATVENDYLTVYPQESIGKGRLQLTNPKRMQPVLDRFNETGSFDLRDYNGLPNHKSYVLPVLKAALERGFLTR